VNVRRQITVPGAVSVVLGSRRGSTPALGVGSIAGSARARVRSIATDFTSLGRAPQPMPAHTSSATHSA